MRTIIYISILFITSCSISNSSWIEEVDGVKLINAVEIPSVELSNPQSINRSLSNNVIVGFNKNGYPTIQINDIEANIKDLSEFVDYTGIHSPFHNDLYIDKAVKMQYVHSVLKELRRSRSRKMAFRFFNLSTNKIQTLQRIMPPDWESNPPFLKPPPIDSSNYNFISVHILRGSLLFNKEPITISNLETQLRSNYAKLEKPVFYNIYYTDAMYRDYLKIQCMIDNILYDLRSKLSNSKYGLDYYSLDDGQKKLITKNYPMTINEEIKNYP